MANFPLMRCYVSFDGADDSTPTWVEKTEYLRKFRITRGGENELEGLDVGSVELEFDNRTRWADPFNTSSPHSPNVKPRRRVWLQSVDQGVTRDQFYGWTGGWPQSFSDGGVLQVSTPQGEDAFAALAKDQVPQTNPPAESYGELIAYDNPVFYFPLSDPVGTQFAQPAIGARPNDTTRANGAPVFGASPVIQGTGETALTNSSPAEVGLVWTGSQGTIGYFPGVNSIAFEFWMTVGTTTGTLQLSLWRGYGGFPQTNIHLLGTTLTWTFRNGSASTAITTSVVAGNTYHVVCLLDGGFSRIYINGSSVSSVAEADDLDAEATGDERILYSVSTSDIVTMGHFACYQPALTADRILAHYEAGLNHGHAQELVHTRIGNLLDGSTVSWLTRSLRTASRSILPVYYQGQTRRELIDEAVKAEGDPAMVFQAKDGTIKFFDRAHRSASPWNTVQATFDSNGTAVRYHGVEVDDGESFIYNDVRVTAEGGELQREEDATSQGAYWPVTLDRGTTQNVSDADASAEAVALLAKYKDPLPRVLSLFLKGTNLATRTQMLSRELGDRIRVIYRPRGGGSAIDQELFIRKVVLEGGPDNPYWTANWSLSKR